MYKQTKEHNAVIELPRLRDTWQHLYDSILSPTGAFPQAFTHKPNKEKRKRELQLPCCASTHSTTASRLSCLSCLSSMCASQPRAPRASRPSRLSCLSSTCASQQRAPLASTPTASCASSHSSTPLSCGPLKQPLSHSRVLYERFLHTSSPLSLHSDLLFPSTHAPRPLLGALHPHRQSQGHATPPPCRSSLRKQADEDLLRRSARAFWREISPRPRRVSIRPTGRVTTQCSFDGECR